MVIPWILSYEITSSLGKSMEVIFLCLIIAILLLKCIIKLSKKKSDLDKWLFLGFGYIK